MDRKELEKVNLAHYPGCNSKEEFLALKSTFTNENKFALQCKLMEEQFDEINHANPSTASTNPSKTHFFPASNSNSNSVMSRPKKEERDSSVEILERSDSEDCCSRAERTQFDEAGNRLKFEEAEREQKKANINKNKKSALASKRETSEGKKGNKVRFTNDFM
jgi:hypothetical protein